MMSLFWGARRKSSTSRQLKPETKLQSELGQERYLGGLTVVHMFFYKDLCTRVRILERIISDDTITVSSNIWI